MISSGSELKTVCKELEILTSLQGKNWRGGGGLGGSTPLEQWSTPLEKCQNGAGGSVLGNFQLNNSLTHSNFRYFTFSGKNIKIRPPPGKIWPSLEKSLIFTLLRCIIDKNMHKSIKNIFNTVINNYRKYQMFSWTVISMASYGYTEFSWHSILCGWIFSCWQLLVAGV